MNAIQIGARTAGPEHPCFVIAEAGVNHNGRVDLALKLIDAAAEAGADAVKFQTFKADKLVTASAPKAEYQKKATGADESQLEALARLELPEAAHQELMAHCSRRGIIFLSTPFEEGSADLLEKLGVSAFKLPSGEITNVPFLQHVARKGKPLIVSTGMSTLGEVEAAVNAMQASGNSDIILLHCVSNYPADPRDVNLRAMHTLEAAFGIPVGYSDHTLGNEVSFAAAALGACVIEKHLTLDRKLPGLDHQASAEPQELAALVMGIRKIESARGTGIKRPASSEANTADVARKSLVAAEDLPAGSVLSEKLIAIRRPGTGLPPSFRQHILGRKLKHAVPAGALIALDMLA